MALQVSRRAELPLNEEQQLFAVRRLGVLMEPDLSNPAEVGGVLNPAAARGPDGELYLFPRLVARGNYSRIGIARVLFNEDGDPAGVERLGIALEPTEPYEKNPFSGGGCEDPRITYLESLGSYVMTYTAFSAHGPRIALAASRDLFNWERLGLVSFRPSGPVDFDGLDNKDALLFPRIVADPHDGVPSIGLIHRPVFRGLPSREAMEPLQQRRRLAAAAGVLPSTGQTVETPEMHRARVNRASMWISYCNKPTRLSHLCDLHSHHRLMSPRESWERVKIGAGAPPILTRHGWLVIYHGVAGRPGLSQVRYSAGLVILDEARPEQILYRSRHPILAFNDQEHDESQLHIIFPTGADQRTDLGVPERIDVYYGLSDSRIGVASLTVPHDLPEVLERPESLRDSPQAEAR